MKARAGQIARARQNDKLQVQLKKLAVAQVMGKQPPKLSMDKEPPEKDIFYLDPEKTDEKFGELKTKVEEYSSIFSNGKSYNATESFRDQTSRIDPSSKQFMSLPAEIQHELLLEHIEHVK